MLLQLKQSLQFFKLGKTFYTAVLQSGIPHHSVANASAILQNDPPVEATPDAIRLIQLLHPPAKDAIPHPTSTNNGSITKTEKLREYIKSLCRGKAPGPSGWTAELLYIVTSDNDIAEAVGYLVLDIANNEVCAEATNQLNAARLIAISKPESNSVRPIAVPEVLLKVAKQPLVSAAVKEHGRTLFPRIQLGVGVKGGTETAVIRTQLAIEASPSSVVLKLDFSNAFNSINRARVAEAFYAQECLTSLFGVFESSYRHPSPLLLYDKHGALQKRLQSFQGVRQGDSLGSLAFSLAVQPLYVTAADHRNN